MLNNCTVYMSEAIMLPVASDILPVRLSSYKDQAVSLGSCLSHNSFVCLLCIGCVLFSLPMTYVPAYLSVILGLCMLFILPVTYLPIAALLLPFISHADCFFGHDSSTTEQWPPCEVGLVPLGKRL